MVYLHSRQPPVIHRDLKSSNLLVDRQWRVKVCDFGVAKHLKRVAFGAAFQIVTQSLALFVIGVVFCRYFSFK